MSKSFTSIAYCARSESRFFHLALARLIKAKFHSEVHLYCGSPQEVEFYESQNSDGVFTSVTDSEFIRNKPIPEDMADAAIFERARSYEEKYHRTYNFLTVNNRHLGRGYMLGGFYHPRSRQSEIPYNQMVYMYNQAFEFWENEFEMKNITLCLNGSPIPSRVSAEFGVPFRIMTRSRLENLHYWAWNEFYESPEIRKAFDSLSSIPEIDLDQPYHGHRVARSRYMKSFSARMAVHNIAMTTARHVYWNMRGYAKAKGYYYTEQVKHAFRKWSDYRKVSKIATTKLTDLEGKPFVFFPLHIEPEMALQGLSPEYFFQQAAIASISRDLPVGITLAVKEAYGAIGRRPDNSHIWAFHLWRRSRKRIR